MRNKPFKAWLRQQYDLWRYRREIALYPCGGLGAAAEAMYYLNRAAKGNMQENTIYGLKNAFIKYLYQHRRCTSVQAEKQELICFHCQGSGIDPYAGWSGRGDEYCERCGGDGIYAIHYLYKFTFRVCQKEYTWHQPQKLVTWPVETTTEILGEYDNKTTHEYLADIGINHYLLTVYACLRNNGVSANELPSLISLKDSIKTSCRWWWMKQLGYPMNWWFRPIYEIVMFYREWQRRRKFNKATVIDIPF